MRAGIFGLLLLGACAPDFDAAEPDADELGILGGVTARERYATSAVSLAFRDGTAVDAPYCSGVLVRPDLVLTAAHCVDFVDPSQIVVNYGVQSPSTMGARTYEVLDLVVHPGWDPNTLVDDLAAVHLSRDVAQFVLYFPVLPPARGFTGTDIGEDALAVGFGLTDDGGSGVRERTFVPIVDLGLPGVVLTDGSTSSVCYGDSGGPLYYLRGGKGYVAGIHSFVGDEGCTTFSGHTRLDQQASFLSAL